MSMNYFTNNETVTATQNDAVLINSNKFTATKRKFENDTKDFQSTKRIHFFHTLPSNLIQQQQNMPNITYSSPDYKPNFRLSANATANMANITSINTPSTMVEDTMMMEENFTDEDEVLQTPCYMTSFSDYMSHNIRPDLDQGGYTGSLELGWNEMYNV